MFSVLGGLLSALLGGQSVVMGDAGYKLHRVSDRCPGESRQYICSILSFLQPPSCGPSPNTAGYWEGHRAVKRYAQYLLPGTHCISSRMASFSGCVFMPELVFQEIP